MITPQTNTTLEEMAQKIKSLHSFVICGHVSPDGDCIGSQLALAHALDKAGKQVTCVLAGDNQVEENLLFLPGIETMIPASNFEENADAFIAVDVPSVERLGGGADIQKRCAVTFTLDHHAYDQVMSQYNYVDPDKASCSLVIWDLCHHLTDGIDESIALCAYTGLVTDTGGFRFQNSDEAAFHAAAEMLSIGVDPSYVATQVFQNRKIPSLRLEALVLERMEIAADCSYALSYLTLRDFEQTGATKADADPLINTLRSIKGVRVACILREQEESVRGSFRAKDDTDVAALARVWDGGGHRAAAGFTVYAPLADALPQVRNVLNDTLNK